MKMNTELFTKCVGCVTFTPMERLKDKANARRQRQADALKDRCAEGNRLATLAKRALRRLTANVARTNEISSHLGNTHLSKNSSRALTRFEKMLGELSESRSLIEYRSVNKRRREKTSMA